MFETLRNYARQAFGRLGIYVLLALLFWGCDSEPETETRTFGNQEMAALLDSIARNTDPMDNYAMNSGRAAFYKAQIERATDPQQRIQGQLLYGLELLQAGQTEESIVVFTQLKDLLEQNGYGLNEGTKQIYEMLALGYLRLGEQQNCVQQANPFSCFIPLQPEGVHQFRRGSETAIRLYEEILQQFPEDKQSRWLLNIAYMTLGEYPGGVPAQLRIDEAELRSELPDFPTFPNVAVELDVAVNGLSGSVSMVDYTNDGLLDLLVTSYGPFDPCRFFVNTGSAGFDDRTEAAGLAGHTGGLNLIHADYNNDGWMDVLILRGAWFNQGGNIPNSLLRNNGDGTFTDVTKAVGMLSFHPTQTARWADFNNDGWLDVFIGNETTMVGQEQLLHPCELYLNEGGERFRNVAAEAGVTINKWVKGTASGDINNDGLPDLYISMPGEPNLLFLNEGPAADGVPRFQEVAATWHTQQPVMSFPAWFWDFNNDGWDDLFVASYDFREVDRIGASVLAEFDGEAFDPQEVPRLYQNTGQGEFIEVTERTGLAKVMYAMGSNFGDLNADGYPDFYIGTGAPDLRSLTPNRMFVNQAGNRFGEVTMGGFGHLQKGHGIAFGDYDNDGDEDVYCVAGGAYEGDVAQNLLFENPTNPERWVRFVLEGTQSNRCAIGARLILELQAPSGEVRRIFRRISSGGSFGANPLWQTIGLGEESIQSISVQWPGSTDLEVFSGTPEMGTTHILREGTGEVIIN